MNASAIGIGVVLGSFGAAVGASYLLWYLHLQEGRSGSDWFMGNMAAVAVFCGSYGASLLVSNESVRVALGVVSFTALCFMGPFFLVFGLDYTGRRDLVNAPLLALVGAVPLVAGVAAVTNPVHHLIWTDFQFAPAFGLATVSYAVQPVGIVALLFSIGTGGVGSLLLVGAISSYGPLYRREATAVVLSTVPPTVGVSLWLFEVGPVPQLHLTAPLMLVHVSLDAYAFVGTHMFESNPATQRMAERTGLNSLSEPVFVLDTERRIVRVNDSAAALFFDEPSAALPRPLEAVFGFDLAALREAGEVSADEAGGKTFAVSDTVLTDPGGETVGTMLVLYDVTEERQREQQLSVLNRVLRHNLRNEMTLIGGHARLLTSDLRDSERSQQAGTIAAASDRLLSIAEKVREFEKIQERGVRPEACSPSAVLDSIDETWGDADEDPSVERTVRPSDLRIRTDSLLLSTALSNLIENAVVHSAESDPTVRVSVRESPETDGRFVFEVRDDNERIPEHELDTIRAGGETPLQHGQGIGLWLVYWSVQKLRGELTFRYEDGNVAVVTIPNL
ncbi:histidine kinase N-terminal 7TM domain-containing protein [Halorubrum ejinorense]|uniref:histidine kinase n=1 Tax=Halorubrum ejinorense TaxID=425309 RepID=A0AAV3SVQ4_9EURY